MVYVVYRHKVPVWSCWTLRDSLCYILHQIKPCFTWVYNFSIRVNPGSVLYTPPWADDEEYDCGWPAIEGAEADIPALRIIGPYEVM